MSNANSLPQFAPATSDVGGLVELTFDFFPSITDRVMGVQRSSPSTDSFISLFFSFDLDRRLPSGRLSKRDRLYVGELMYTSWIVMKSPYRIITVSKLL